MVIVNKAPPCPLLESSDFSPRPPFKLTGPRRRFIMERGDADDNDPGRGAAERRVRHHRFPRDQQDPLCAPRACRPGDARRRGARLHPAAGLPPAEALRDARGRHLFKQHPGQLRLRPRRLPGRRAARQAGADRRDRHRAAPGVEGFPRVCPPLPPRHRHRALLGRDPGRRRRPAAGADDLHQPHPHRAGKLLLHQLRLSPRRGARPPPPA